MAASQRLNTVLGGGDVPLGGRITVIGATRDHDLSALPPEQTSVVQTHFPDHQHWAARGIQTRTDLPDATDVTLICLPRAKALGLSWIAEAAQRSTQMLVIDGQKTDGIESVLKAIKRIAPVTGTYAKAHGKTLWLAPAPALADLAPPPPASVAGFEVAHGVFSADGIDPGSRLLAGALPARLGARVADLGAGWGYLAAQILQRGDVEDLHLVEADHSALTCARANVRDPRAVFHWDDATRWQTPALLDAVVMNPPFHTGRAATPELGQAFVQTAARSLKPGGQLWLVANRHLPYEQTLEALFGRVEPQVQQDGFKVIRASHPKPRRRG